jgi:hypothetical protein
VSSLPGTPADPLPAGVAETCAAAVLA